MDRAELTGHTALGLVALVGFFVYTASYSVVYHVLKSGSVAKPVAVLELWMVLTHLVTAAAACVLYAVFTVRTADVQTAVFLGVALSVTFCGTACINDAAQCAVFFPAAAWAPLAAAGAIAWAWIVYLASLGCQAGAAISLGASTSHLVAPLVLALVAPAIAATLKQTCGVGPQPALPLALHVTLLVLAYGIWTASAWAKQGIRALMRVLAALLVILDAFVALQATPPAIACLVLSGIALSDGQVTAVLLGSTTSTPVAPRGTKRH